MKADLHYLGSTQGRNFSNFVEGALKDIMELDFMEVASSGSSGQCNELCSAHDRGISYNDLL